MTADDKYSFLNRDNLLQHLQMPLSQKKIFPVFFFFAFGKSRFNFEHFYKKVDPHSLSIFEATEKRG